MATKILTALLGGSWAVAGNWTPSGVPGALDDAIIGAASTTQPVTGGGAAATLTVAGAASLAGAYRFGALSVGSAATAGSLTLQAGAAVAATTATLLFGPLTVANAGAKLTVSGALTLGGTRSSTLTFKTNALTLSNGGAVQAGSVVLAPVFGGDTISIDSTSTLEIGSAGAALPGRLTIDADGSLVGLGDVAVPATLNQGRIVAQGGVLSIGGPVTGAGQMQIAAGATLSLYGGASTQAIAFTGAGATLEVTTAVVQSGSVFNTVLSAQGQISGFIPGDTIYYVGNGTVTAANWTAGPGGFGTLTLRGGTTVLGTLTLVGSYAGQTFQVTPHASNGYDIAIATSGTGGGVVSPGTPAPDAYTWTAGRGGAWTDPANWKDDTTGAAPALIAPGVNNLVTLRGGSASYFVVNGPGNAATLQALGNTTLNGVFNVGAATVGQGGAAAGLSLSAGTTLTLGSLTLLDGPLQAAGAGTKLIVSGVATLGGLGAAAVDQLAANSLTLGAGAVAQVGRLVLAPALLSNQITIDATASLEIGIAGGTASGTLTIDAGNSLSGVGAITAANGLVNQGAILASGGALALFGPVSGAGALQIGAGATLWLASGVSTQGASFIGPGGTLEISAAIGPGSTTVLTEQGVIDGFVPGDTIWFNGVSPVTSVAYQAGAGGVGTLALLNGATRVGSLALSGVYAQSVFTLAAHGTQGYDITVAVRPSSDPLFDAAYYLARNPDVAAAGVDPYQHYMSVGWKEGRNPDAYFDTRYYLASNRDVAAVGINPLAHFEAYGWREGRQPSLAFSSTLYLAANPDVRAVAINPLQHYLVYGKAEGRAASLVGFDGNLNRADPLVSAAYLDPQLGATLIPAGAAGQAQAAELYHASGWQAGLNPNPWFDTQYYLTQNPDVKAAGIDPLQHYESFGWREGRDPSLLFSNAGYFAAHPDVRAANIVPLLHYVSYGQFEGRPTFLSGGAASADILIDATYYDRQLGAALIPTGAAGAQQAAWSYATLGWQRGLNPNPWFDTAYYLAHNADVAAAHINPLLHFEDFGWREGRDPSASFSTSKYLAANADVRAVGLDPLVHFIQYGQAEGRSAYAVG